MTTQPSHNGNEEQWTAGVNVGEPIRQLGHRNRGAREVVCRQRRDTLSGVLRATAEDAVMGGRQR